MEFLPGNVSSDLKTFMSGFHLLPHCKICQVFGTNHPDLFVAITRDIHAGVPRKEIIDKYSKFLPPGMAPINRMNIASHKNHTNPRHLINNIIANPEKDMTEGRAIVKLLQKVSDEQISRQDIMESLNMARLQDMADLEVMLVRNRVAWKKAMAEDTKDIGRLKELERLEARFLSLVERRQSLWNDMHMLLLKEMKDSREAVESKLRAELYRIMVDNLNLHLVEFMKEVSDILLHDEFAEHPDRGARIFQRMAKAMNSHLQPMMKEFMETGMADAKFEDVTV